MRAHQFLTTRFLAMCIGIALAPGGAMAAQSALVVSFDADEVVQVDLDSCRLGTRFPAGVLPGDVAIDASGRNAYVASGDSVEFLDLEKGATVFTLPLEGSPNAILLLPDGRRAYVLDGREGSDGTIVDVVERRVIGPLRIGLRGVNTGGLVLDSAGRNAYVAHPFGETGHVSRIDTSRDVARPFGVPTANSASVLLSRDDRRAWVTHGPVAFHEEDPGVLTELELGDELRVVRQMQLPRAGAGLTHTGTGLAYISEWGARNTFVVDLEAQAVVKVLEGAGGTPLCRAGSAFCYLPDYPRNRVWIVDARMHEVVGSIAIVNPLRLRLIPHPAEPSAGETEEEGPLQPGCCTADANCDGRVTAADMAAIAAASLGLRAPRCGADATCDGTVDAADVRAIADRLFH